MEHRCEGCEWYTVYQWGVVGGQRGSWWRGWTRANVLSSTHFMVEEWCRHTFMYMLSTRLKTKNNFNNFQSLLYRNPRNIYFIFSRYMYPRVHVHIHVVYVIHSCNAETLWNRCGRWTVDVRRVWGNVALIELHAYKGTCKYVLHLMKEEFWRPTKPWQMQPISITGTRVYLT